MLKQNLTENLERYYKFRNSMGYSTNNNSICYLKEYCDFCIKMYGDSELLTKEILDSWLNIRIFKKNKTGKFNISAVLKHLKFI